MKKRRGIGELELGDRPLFYQECVGLEADDRQEGQSDTLCMEALPNAENGRCTSRWVVWYRPGAIREAWTEGSVEAWREGMQPTSDVRDLVSRGVEVIIVVCERIWGVRQEIGGVDQRTSLRSTSTIRVCLPEHEQHGTRWKKGAGAESQASRSVRLGRQNAGLGLFIHGFGLKSGKIKGTKWMGGQRVLPSEL